MKILKENMLRFGTKNLNEQGKSPDADGNPQRAPDPLSYKFNNEPAPNVFVAMGQIKHAQLKLEKVRKFADNEVLDNYEKRNEKNVKAYHEAERLIYEAITIIEKI